MNYRVVWEIDVDADDPVEAAKQARKLQEPGTSALVFDVVGKKGKKTRVDLDSAYIDPENIKCCPACGEESLNVVEQVNYNVESVSINTVKEFASRLDESECTEIERDVTGIYCSMCGAEWDNIPAFKKAVEKVLKKK